MRGNTVNTLCLHRTATPMGLTMAEPCILLTVSSETNANRMEHTRCWLAAYTRSRHESHVASQLSSKGVESLLPTYAKLARWSDRIRRSQVPLFPTRQKKSWAPARVVCQVSDRARVPGCGRCEIHRIFSW